jgi:hypothetical protein
VGFVGGPGGIGAYSMGKGISLCDNGGIISGLVLNLGLFVLFEANIIDSLGATISSGSLGMMKGLKGVVGTVGRERRARMQLWRLGAVESVMPSCIK